MTANNTLGANVRLQMVAILVGFLAMPVAATDSVRISYFNSYPRMDRSAESGEVEISRRPPAMPRGYAPLESGVDAYFAEISKILVDSRIEGDWERSKVHGQFIRVTVELGGKKITLGSSFGGGYVDSFPDPDGTNERHRNALVAILKLTTDRMQAAIPK